MSFDNLGLSPKVLSAVTAAGFETPTPIQLSAIPLAVAGKDVLGIAQTGTGKTASFVLPMLTRLERGRARARMPRTLILEPTRELAAQVAEHFEILGKNHKLTVALLIGGVSYDDQNRKLDRGADVVIATPGRLLDHIERGKLLLNGIEILVVDEADRMLDMGFIPDIERICKLLPFTRQTLFFSATMPPEIKRLADKFLHSPERVEVAPQATAAATIVQRLKKAPDDAAGKREALRELMREIDVKNAIIFCNRKKDVGIVYRSLQRHGFSVGALHGDLDQHQRTATLDAFRNGTIAFLAASDVAARGLDIPDVSHIFNYDVPIHPEDYIHRIGRTGRAGREGFAAMLVTPKDFKALKAIEKMLKQEIPWIDGATALAETSEASESRTNGNGNGRNRGGGRSRRHKGPPGKSDQVTQPHRNAGNGNGANKRDDHRHDATHSQHKHHGERKETQRPAAHSAPAPVERPARPTAQPASSKGQQGMGDHVPAFMMRPVRIP
ncbi:MAG: DEAD/DEAH box helicase [Methyloceanibacter sp.]|uniref:DEAD/DEAH box helicase n=1 Tax=Methyloceanibacter sp. TaxID=1965321 RepID=UPI003D9AF371